MFKTMKAQAWVWAAASGQIFLPFCHNARMWQTDGRTEFSSLYPVCITCSAV